MVDARDASVPVVVNGGIEQFSDVESVKTRTRTAAVMSSEALLENPGLFAVDSSSWSPRQTLEQQFRYANDYLSWCQNYPPLPGVSGQSCNIVRSHLFKMLFRYLSEQPDLRDKMASHQVRRLIDFEQICHELFSRYKNLSATELDAYASSSVSSSWYRRHWDAKRVTSPSSKAGQTLVLSTQESKEAVQLRIAKLKKDRQERKLICQ
jgi:hypothetical protein